MDSLLSCAVLSRATPHQINLSTVTLGPLTCGIWTQRYTVWQVGPTLDESRRRQLTQIRGLPSAEVLPDSASARRAPFAPRYCSQ